MSSCSPEAAPETIAEATISELRSRPGVVSAVALGVVGHAAGNATLAFGAGLLAASLGGAASLPATLHSAWGGSLATLPFVSLVGAIVKAGCGAVLAHAERSVGAHVAARYRIRVLDGLLGTGLSLPEPRALASITVRLREVESAVTAGHLAQLRSVAQLLPLAVCLVIWSPGLSFAAALLVVPFAFALAALRRAARRSAGRAQLLAEELECGVDELVRNADLWRSYGAGDAVVSAVGRSSRAARIAAARFELGRAALSGANEVLGVFGVLGALAFGARYGFPGGSALLPFAAVFFMGYRPLRDLGDARAWTQRGAVALDGLKAVVNGEGGATASNADDGPPPAANRSGRLSLEMFGALTRGPATTLDLAPGELVCVVGRTGAGKTTLLRALLGLEPARGRVRWAGRDVTRAPSGPAHRPFAWVPQEAPLVTGTVVENVMLVGCSEEAARRALRDVGAGRLSTAVDGREVVGPGGRALSGGERRQVALARALASDLPVLLLDEPTEGLDPEAAHTVLRVLAGLRGRKTVIVTTHREEVAKIADRVVRLGDHAVDAAAE